MKYFTCKVWNSSFDVPETTFLSIPLSSFEEGIVDNKFISTKCSFSFGQRFRTPTQVRRRLRNARFTFDHFFFGQSSSDFDQQMRISQFGHRTLAFSPSTVGTGTEGPVDVDRFSFRRHRSTPESVARMQSESMSTCSGQRGPSQFRRGDGFSWRTKSQHLFFRPSKWIRPETKSPVFVRNAEKTFRPTDGSQLSWRSRAELERRKSVRHCFQTGPPTKLSSLHSAHRFGFESSEAMPSQTECKSKFNLTCI